MSLTELARVAVPALLGLLVVLTLEGFRRRDLAAAVNGLVALCTALLPAAVEVGVRAAGGDVRIGPVLPLWIAVAGILHAVGMLGLYESTGWWDHLTHTVSAALVAAFVYAGVVVAGRHANGLDLPHAGAVGLTVAAVLLVGVFWELVELAARDVGERYGVEPVLVHYGLRDTALDMVFNGLGAVVVVVVDLRVFVPVVDQFPGIVGRLLVVCGFVVASSALLALWVGGDA